jgi:hypothetical protein
MLFKLTNILALYQSFINNIFRKYLDDFVVAYLNDIHIYSKTKEKHIKYVTVTILTYQVIAASGEEVVLGQVV